MQALRTCISFPLIGIALIDLPCQIFKGAKGIPPLSACGSALDEGVECLAVKAAQLAFAFGSQIKSRNEFQLFSPFL